MSTSSSRSSSRSSRRSRKMMTTSSLATASAILVASTASVGVHARIADRSRVVKAQRNGNGRREKNGLAIEGASYRGRTVGRGVDESLRARATNNNSNKNNNAQRKTSSSSSSLPKKEAVQRREREGSSTSSTEMVEMTTTISSSSTASLRGSSLEQADVIMNETPEAFNRRLSSQLTGCCYTYQSYSASNMCSLYGESCAGGGGGNSHDSGDETCEQKGLSFIGISFSVNTANGNPYSYQLCDQFPMENIIDRNYNYVMSMDEDGWLVGGGYKSFDYSGKMPYIDSSHTEILRIGSLDTDKGGTSIDQVYQAMNSVSFSPFSVFPEYLKGGGGHHSGDDSSSGVPSADITLVISIVDTFEDGSSYSAYDNFLDELFSALDAVNGGACMDDKDTNPHVSMARGVKFKSSTHMSDYMYAANLEVATWQAMYPKGVPIGGSGYASFPAGSRGNKQYVGYGNLYFFFDRANITKAFHPNRDLSSTESYYATLYKSTDISSYYSSTTSVDFNYGGSQDQNNNGGSWEHNPYSWKATMAMHDMTDGWDLPPNCEQEGETFFGIPLSRKSDSNLQTSNTFQSQFDFENIIDRNNTYITGFGTNHGWLVGEQIGNGAGSIVDKDTAHIPIFYTGTTNPDMGGMSLANLIKVGKRIEFGTLYIKPAFVFIDDNGHIKLQFEMDPNSALAYLYNSLCKELGIAWNYETPYNKEKVYTNCAMHATGDRAKYGCGPEGTGVGGFCPQMTVAYSPKFESADASTAYLTQCNNYVDYWRSLYPSGVAVGTSSFCPGGGCLGLYLNRYDLFNVFKPDLGGSWVEYGENTMAPTVSPAPTWTGGCDEPHNFHLDRCFRKRARPKASAVVWDSLGAVGQFTMFLLVFMSVTLAVSIFLARARKRRKKGESYMAFLMRDSRTQRKKKSKKRRKVRGNTDLEEAMLEPEKPPLRGKSRSKSRTRSKSKSRCEKGEIEDDDVSNGARSRKSTRSSKSRSKSRSNRSSSRKRDDGDNEPSTPRQQLV